MLWVIKMIILREYVCYIRFWVVLYSLYKMTILNRDIIYLQ